MSKPVVIVDHVWKRYHKRFGSSTLWSLFGRRERTDDEFWALRDVSFEVEPGEVFGVIGANGSGKSTLLKTLSRITHPTRGWVEARGRVASMLEVGTGFHPELTGRENVFLSGAIMGMKRAEIKKRFDEIVAFSGVEEFIDTPVKRYSSGMYVRLAFAVSSHVETDILLIDEVLAVGDAAFQRKCTAKMAALRKSGCTILFVSHDMYAMRTVCSRVVVLASGATVFVGTPEDAIEAYLGQSAPEARAAISSGERRWTEGAWAATENLALSAVRTLDSNGMAQHSFSMDEPVNIEISYRPLHAGGVVGQTIVLTAQDNVVVLSSLNPPTEHENRAYTATCIVPGGLLNEGYFHVTVLLWLEDFASALRVDNVVAFKVVRTVPRPAGYLGEWAGVICPALSWEIRGS